MSGNEYGVTYVTQIGIYLLTSETFDLKKAAVTSHYHIPPDQPLVVLTGPLLFGARTSGCGPLRHANIVIGSSHSIELPQKNQYCIQRTETADVGVYKQTLQPAFSRRHSPYMRFA